MSSTDSFPSTKRVPEGILLKIRAVPGASRDRLAGLHGNAVKITVRAPPEKGKANEAVTRVVAKVLGLRQSAVSVASGGASRDKWLLVEGLDMETLVARLTGLL